jgi:predicted RNase H-like nuclease (RuvC/YqgF family)
MMVAEELQKAAGTEVGDDENDVLRQENEALRRELQSRDAEIIRLKQALAAKDGEIAAQKQALEEARWQLDEIGKALPQAVAAYRALVVQANPGVLAELITGDIVEEVDESLKKARALVERVRQEIEAEASKTRIPAGAPPRAPLDLSALSPREKIKYAMGSSPS